MFEEIPKSTGLKCPVSDGDLIWVGSQGGAMMTVLDGDHYYESSTNPRVKFTKNSRSFFYHLNGSNRYFKFEEGKWVEYFCAYSRRKDSNLFQIGTPENEIEKYFSEKEAKRKIHQEEYERKVSSGEITQFFPVALRVNAKAVAKEFMSTQPMSMPSGKIFQLFHEYKSDRQEYPYYVSEENVEKMMVTWKTDDIQAGDKIEEWDLGGWESLAGKAGENVIRNGKIIHSRLTRMS